MQADTDGGSQLHFGEDDAESRRRPRGPHCPSGSRLRCRSRRDASECGARGRTWRTGDRRAWHGAPTYAPVAHRSRCRRRTSPLALLPLEVRLAADPNVESEEQKRPEQDCCNYGQHPGHGPERIEVVVDCGDDDADDNPDDREERWPPVAEPHDSLMLTHAPNDGRVDRLPAARGGRPACQPSADARPVPGGGPSRPVAEGPAVALARTQAPLFFGTRGPPNPFHRTHAAAFPNAPFRDQSGSAHRRGRHHDGRAFTAGERLTLSAAEAKAQREQDARASPSQTCQQMRCATR